jgi:hypothetical protein
MSDEDGKVFRNAGARFREIGEEWTWLEEYALIGTADYRLACPADRVCEFGSGVFTAGTPQGTRKHFSGIQAVHVFGVGAIHVRVTDGNGPCIVGITQEAMALRNAPNWKSIEDGIRKLRGS